MPLYTLYYLCFIIIHTVSVMALASSRYPLLTIPSISSGVKLPIFQPSATIRTINLRELPNTIICRATAAANTKGSLAFNRTHFRKPNLQSNGLNIFQFDFNYLIVVVVLIRGYNCNLEFY
ncbi:unnamed protein product [Cuscuta europaea]|uniref:Uncharacterized protein n=1 Tax=Cuscuta europaea TaxID=41803 RepID=A0A9P1DZJ2_CUSEU|nr:unnamed protein product [Cuscuta europaea]